MCRCVLCVCVCVRFSPPPLWMKSSLQHKTSAKTHKAQGMQSSTRLFNTFHKALGQSLKGSSSWAALWLEANISTQTSLIRTSTDNTCKLLQIWNMIGSLHWSSTLLVDLWALRCGRDEQTPEPWQWWTLLWPWANRTLLQARQLLSMMHCAKQP